MLAKPQILLNSRAKQVKMRSGDPKLKFLEGKEHSEAKFNYWLAKWKAKDSITDEGGGF